jgi:hypothetical protein
LRNASSASCSRASSRARRDGHDAIDVLAIRNQSEQVTAETVPDPVQRHARRARLHELDHRGTVLRRPVANVDLKAAQRRRRRLADAAK